jgi:hypothetical protein
MRFKSRMGGTSPALLIPMDLKLKTDNVLVCELRELVKREREMKKLTRAFLREVKRRNLDRIPNGRGPVPVQPELPIADELD